MPVSCKSYEKKNMSSISMICFLQVSMYKFGFGVVRKATSVTFYVLPDLPTSFPPITATLTVFFCFLDNPLKMLKGLVFFWLGEDMGVTSWAGWGAATVKYRQKNTLFVTQQLLRHTRGGCSLVPVVCPNHPHYAPLCLAGDNDGIKMWRTHTRYNELRQN